MGSRRRGWKRSKPSHEWKCLRLRLLATSCKIRFLFPKGKPLVVSNAALYTAILASIFMTSPLLVSGYCKAPETGASRSPLLGYCPDVYGIVIHRLVPLGRAEKAVLNEIKNLVVPDFKDHASIAFERYVGAISPKPGFKTRIVDVHGLTLLFGGYRKASYH